MVSLLMLICVTGPQWVNGQQNHDENMCEFVVETVPTDGLAPYCQEICRYCDDQINWVILSFMR